MAAKISATPTPRNHMQAENIWEALGASRVALLTTFRRDGAGVGTPVGIHIAQGKVYFTTWSTTGKTKRLVHTPRVTLAPCTQLGRVTGATVGGIARRLEGAEARLITSQVVTQSVRGQIWRMIYRLRGWQPVLYEVAPTGEG